MNMAFLYILRCTRWPFLLSSRKIGIVLYIFDLLKLFPSPGTVASTRVTHCVFVVVDGFGPPPLSSWAEAGVEAGLRRPSFVYCY